MRVLGWKEDGFCLPVVCKAIPSSLCPAIKIPICGLSAPPFCLVYFSVSSGVLELLDKEVPSHVVRKMWGSRKQAVLPSAVLAMTD